MPSLPTETLKQIASIWQRLSAPGRIAVTATLVLAVGGLLLVTFWAREPSYVVLESELDVTRASKIADALEGFGIEYETRDLGTTILVPAQDASRARMKLAGQNLIAAPGGAEEEKMGPWTGTKEREAARIRKLEQKIGQTIASFDGIDRARVLISPGHESPYKDRQRAPTASVNVRAVSGHTIGHQQVQGIVRTVTNSVPGMAAEDVTVTGADGRPLTRPRGSGEDVEGDLIAQASSTERQLTDKVRALLDGVVGPGHYRVGITVLMNFDSTETRRRTFIDDEKVLKLKDSQKTSRPVISGTEGSTGGSLPTEKTEKKIEEYEVPMVETVETKRTPEIKNISAGITIDEAVFTDPARLAELKSALEGALGISAERGDKLDVTLLPFAEIQFVEAAAGGGGFAMDKVLDLLQYAAAGLVGLGLLMFFKSVLKAKPVPEGTSASGTQLDLTVGDDELDLPEEKVSPKVLERRKVKKEIVRAIDQDPRGVAKLVEMWLNEEGA